MIKRLTVRGYKSLANCEIELSPLTVILGPNGAGKSNLLDLVGLLSRLATRETLREAFTEHRGRPIEAFHSPDGFGESAYERILKTDRLDFQVVCDLELQPRLVDEINRGLADRQRLVASGATYTKVTETLLRYTIEIQIHPKTGALFVSDERLEPLTRKLDVKKSRAAFFEKDRRHASDPGTAERFIARIERQGHPRYFEPHRPRTLLSELSDPVYHPHVVAAARELASWRVYYVEPGRMHDELGVQSADEPGRHGELLAACYYTLQRERPATLAGIVRSLREFVPGLTALRVDVRDGLLELKAVFDDGGEFPARLLSEGTLRLLCVLAICTSNAPPAVVVYEEPENGVNPARLELIANLLKTASSHSPMRSQFILTTHSLQVCDLLPDHLLLSHWSRAGGTKFTRESWDTDTLFFQTEVRDALDDAVRGRSRRAEAASS